MVSQLDALVGQEIDGYLIEKSLGAGGMARVYLGRDVRLDRRVAIKVIQPQARTDPTYTARFIKEAKAIASLEHPNILHIYRFGEVKGLYYMAMQYIDGVDMSWVLKGYADDKLLMPLEDVMLVMPQIASALDYAHAQGIIHRDVKPANVMLDKTGKVYLMDFGLALKQIDGTYGEIFGTPHYIAPEQAISSAGAVPQSDQYALGVMLYEILTGSLPFEEGSAMDIAMAHMTEPLPSPLEKNPDLSPALVTILERVLQKEPGDRYPSCTAMVAELQKAIKGTGPATKSSRQSMVSIPKKIEAYQAEHPSPLPPLTPPPVIPPSVKAAPPIAQVVAAQEAAAATAKPKPEQSKTMLQRIRSQDRWTLIGLGIFMIAMVGVVVLLVVLATRKNQPPPPPTSVVVIIVSPDANPTIDAGAGIGNTAEPTLTETPLPTDAPVDVPTDAPTEQPFVVVATSTPTEQPFVVMATATPQPLPSLTTPPTDVLDAWTLRLLANGQETLYVINESGPSIPEFRSRQLLLTTGGVVGVKGAEWDQNRLISGQCVRLEQNGRSPAPATTCQQVGVAVKVEGTNRFWKSEYSTVSIYYRDVLMAVCQTADIHAAGCVVTIPFSAAADG